MAYGNNNFNGGYQKPAATTAKKKSEDSNTKGVRLTNYDQMKYLDINYWKKAYMFYRNVDQEGVKL